MESGSASLIPEFHPEVSEYYVLPRRSKTADHLELHFLPDMLLACEFAFCCGQQNVTCHELKPSKHPHFKQTLGVDDLLSVIVRQEEFGTCRLELRGWQTRTYELDRGAPRAKLIVGASA